MDTNVKRREWVKTAAIIFLAVLLVLTFFSNTIMNASLPEVATQQVTQGTINAKIRASGTITANETYNVKLAQSRKIESVKCKVGQAVNAGDVLVRLDDPDLRLEAVLVIDRAGHPDRLMRRAEMRIAADLRGNVAAQTADAGDVVTLGGFVQLPPDMGLALALGRRPAAFHHHGRRRCGTEKF